MRRIHWYGPTVVLLITTLLVMIAGPRVARNIAWAGVDARIELVKQRLSENPSLAELSESFRRVGEVVAPSVVHIEVSSRSKSPRGRIFPDEELLRRWRFEGLPHRFKRDPFGGERDDEPGDDDDEEDDEEDIEKYNVPRDSGSGSGWVYDNDGHIVTNHHVVDGADVITVRFQDGSDHKATVVGTDPKTDIAVIKVDTRDLHPSSIADEKVEQGDIVFAFGSPFQFEFSMSQGIVSGTGRRLHILDRKQGYENFIQTDASINPGNSGGPLTNIYGQVVGMNTAIATRTGVYNGLGFAIPVGMTTHVVDQLIKSGRVSRGYLGIFIADLSPKIAKTFGYDGDGVLVESPIPGGPAVDAGVERGDIITEINGEPIDNAEALRRKVAAFPPGTELDLQIFRDGDLRTIEIKLGELPDTISTAKGIDVVPHGEPDKPATLLLRKLGIEAVMTLTEPLADRLDLEFTPGVLVRTVRPQSAAAAAGIASKDIITHVMAVEVKNVEDFIAELGKHDLKEGVRVSIIQRGMPRFSLLELQRD